jgi:hypothetical protein
MYKIVLQIPDTDDAYETLAELRWIGVEGPYGPHVKAAYGKDAEDRRRDALPALEAPHLGAGGGAADEGESPGPARAINC